MAENQYSKKLDAMRLRQLEIAEIDRLRFRMWQQDPMQWLEDRLGESRLNFQWGLRKEFAQHRWDGSPEALYGAWMALVNGDWAAIEAGTGTSKTYWLARVCLWFLDVYKDSLVLTTAPKQAQLTMNLWAEISKIFHKFKKIRPKAQLYNLRLVVEEEDMTSADFDPTQPNLSKSWHMIGVVSGVGSEEESATKMQGYHREHMLIVTEETPGMKHAAMTALKQTCTDDHNLILAVGNPDNRQDPLHKFADLHNVKAFRLSAYDHPNVVSKSSVFPGAVTLGSIKRREKELGKKSPLFQSRVHGISPAQSMDSLISEEWLIKAAKSKLNYDGGYHAVGIDVAQSLDGDKACLAWGRGNILSRVHEFQCNNATHLAYNLFMDDRNLRERGWNVYGTEKLWDYDILPGFCGVDTVGLGIATYNALVDADKEPVSLMGGEWKDCIPDEEYIDEIDKNQETRKAYRFQGLRSQMYFELKEDLRNERVRFDFTDDEELMGRVFDELTAIKVEYKQNFVIVEPKENIKKRLGGKSPNMADAIVYWNWVRKGYRVYMGEMPLSFGSGT